MGSNASHYLSCSAKFTEDDDVILGSFDLGASLCSLIGAAFVVVHFLLKDKRALVLSQLIFWLSMADLGASVGLILSESWLMVADYPDIVCYGLRSVIEFFVVSSWMWTSCIAYYAFHAIVFRNDLFLKEDKKNVARGTYWLMGMFHMVSWGLPLIFCIVLSSADGYTRNERGGWCHPRGLWQIVLWEVPMIAAFVLNALLSLLIVFFIRHRQSKSGKVGARSHLSSRVTKQLGLFLAVYLICWLPDVVSHIVIFIWPKCHLFWLSALQNIFAPSQGFLNCLVYGLSKPVRMQYKNRLLLIGTVLISPLLVVPVLMAWIIALITCDKLNFLRKRRRYRSLGTRLSDNVSTDTDYLVVKEDPFLVEDNSHTLQ